MAIRILIKTTKGVADKWKHQYFTSHGDKWYDTLKHSSLEVYQAILSADGDVEAVDAAIGNKGWTHPSCEICGEYVDRVAVISNGDYSRDDQPANCCSKCLRDAFFALQGEYPSGI